MKRTIMKKVYRLEGLDCAHCAAKIEKKVSGLKGVKEASVNFLTTKMTIEFEEEIIDELLIEIEQIVKKIEPDVIMKRA